MKMSSKVFRSVEGVGVGAGVGEGPGEGVGPGTGVVVVVDISSQRRKTHIVSETTKNIICFISLYYYIKF